MSLKFQVTDQVVPSGVGQSGKGAAALRSERATEMGLGPDSRLQDLTPSGHQRHGAIRYEDGCYLLYKLSLSPVSKVSLENPISYESVDLFIFIITPRTIITITEKNLCQ